MPEEEQAPPEEDQPDKYGLNESEREEFKKAFHLLDADQDFIITRSELREVLKCLGRVPKQQTLERIMKIHKGTSCEGEPGMDYKGFYDYLGKQLLKTDNEEELRMAFTSFDSDPPEGRLNGRELRHCLTHLGVPLTDEEVDNLFTDADYKYEDNGMMEYESLIQKLMQK